MILVQEIIPNTGWNAGARTKAVLIGDGSFEFEVGQSAGIVCGLSNYDISTDYTEIQHAFYIDNVSVKIVESGKDLSNFFVVPKNSTFKFTRFNSIVTYYVNDLFIYTSNVLSIGEVFLNCSLYLAGDSIFNPRVTTTVSCLANLSNLIAFGTDTDFVGLCELSPLSVSSEVEPAPLELSPLIMAGFDLDYGDASLSPLVLEAARFIPNINYGLCEFLPLVLLETKEPELITGDFELRKLIAFGTDTDGIGDVNLRPLTLTAMLEVAILFDIALPFFTGYSPVETINLHQQVYGSSLLNLHTVGYESNTIILNLHTQQWTSTVLSIHEQSWEYVELQTVLNLHEQSWEYVELQTVLNLHEVEWNYPITLLNLHEQSWEYVELQTVLNLHEVEWSLSSYINTLNLHEQSWEYTQTQTVLNLHEQSWEYSPTVLNLHTQQWQLLIETIHLHNLSYSDTDLSVVLNLHEVRYRSALTAAIVNTGLIYARI